MHGTTNTIAVIGDIHSAWSSDDVAYFNQSVYPLLLITGDLGGSEARDGLSIARSLAALSRRTLLMPGNNDVHEYPRIAAELTYRHGRNALLDELHSDARAPALATAIDVEAEATTGAGICGYSAHPVQLPGLDLTIIAGRPFAMGGGALSFPEALEHGFGVRSLEQSAERLCSLVDSAPSDHLVFFAHNGPSGLGARMQDIWGRDFHPEAGDWGDSDLRTAIDYARERGRKLLAVVAGHMHWRLRGGGQRNWLVRQDGILYVNAAKVPRNVRTDQAITRSHIALSLTPEAAHAEEARVSQPIAADPNRD